jgi:4-hydroxy-tetrahydrodipicolinate synthase
MSEKDRFKGITTALITPFDADGELDAGGLKALIDRQIECGVNGIAVVAGSGEYLNLSPAEREQVVRISVEQAAGRIQVIAGVLAPDTRDAVASAKTACAAGAEALLVLTPFYNKPSRDGIVGHFKAVSDATDRPILVYNNPGRTGIHLTTEDYLALAEAGRLSGVKECTRDLAEFSATVAALGERWAILSGEDDLLYPSYELGAPGGIVTTGNIVPALWVSMDAAIAAGDHEKARAVHYAVLPLIQAVYRLNHPALVKGALRTLGLAGGRSRAPLADPRPEQMERIKAVLAGLN